MILLYVAVFLLAGLLASVVYLVVDIRRDLTEYDKVVKKLVV